jgi:hypothetical protein
VTFVGDTSGLAPELVHAALSYWADYAAEVDVFLDHARAEAEQAPLRWQRDQGSSTPRTTVSRDGAPSSHNWLMHSYTLPGTTRSWPKAESCGFVPAMGRAKANARGLRRHHPLGSSATTRPGRRRSGRSCLDDIAAGGLKRRDHLMHIEPSADNQRLAAASRSSVEADQGMSLQADCFAEQPISKSVA